MSDYRILVGDCREAMAEMEPASVDAVVTDPPYGTGQWQRGASGNGRDPTARFSRESWDVWNPDWLDDALRISRGPVLLFLPAARIPEVAAPPWRLLVWCKTDPRPRFGGQVPHAIEPVVALRSNLMRGERDWFSDSAPRIGRDADATGHPHQKPVDVVRWLVSLCARRGDTVLDPFTGSGTTGVACTLEGVDFIGIEKEPQYADIARRRIANTQPSLFANPGPDEAA